MPNGVTKLLGLCGIVERVYLLLASGSEEIELPLLHPEEDWRIELPGYGVDLTELLLLLLLLLSLGVTDAFGAKPLLCHPFLLQ